VIKNDDLTVINAKNLRYIICRFGWIIVYVKYFLELFGCGKYFRETICGLFLFKIKDEDEEKVDADVLYGKFLYEDDFESSSRKAIWFVEMSTILIKSLSHHPIPDKFRYKKILSFNNCSSVMRLLSTFKTLKSVCF